MGGHLLKSKTFLLGFDVAQDGLGFGLALQTGTQQSGGSFLRPAAAGMRLCGRGQERGADRRHGPVPDRVDLKKQHPHSPPTARAASK